jgi:Domain of unknown function (DUF4328)
VTGLRSGACARCGLPGPSGAFCPRCGSRISRLVWVATPPPGPPTQAPVHRPRYAGPPRYRVPPRWGFPVGPWTPPEAAAVPAPPALDGARAVLGTLVPLLWATASVSAVAAVAEAWRYVLLLASRTDALDARAVRLSDALVVAAGTVAPVLALIAGGLLVLWTLRAAGAAAEHAGVRPSRSRRALVAGWLVPVLNLAVPGAVLAEVEHSALLRPPGERPRPSRRLAVWWALWIADGLLVAVVALWSLRTGVQARADGVLLHVLLDVLAAVTAGATARLIIHLTRLLAPARSVRREVVVAVRGNPGRALPA